MKAGCVFLVVFWCRCCGWFSFRPSSRFSFRRSARSVVSPFGSFPRFAFRPAFRPAFRFVCPFGRVGWEICGSRRFCQLVGSGRVFVFFRVLVSWQRWGCIVEGVGSTNGWAWASMRMIAFRVAGAWGVSFGEAFDGAWRRLRVICRRVWRMRSVAMVRRIESEERIRVNERRDDDGRLCLNAPFLSAHLRRRWAT